MKWIFSGGGYFRLSPYSLIKNWSKKSNYIMTDFHPRDFDSDQPIIKGLGINRKFKSYVGLRGCMGKLEKLINDFDRFNTKWAKTGLEVTGRPNSKCQVPVQFCSLWGIETMAILEPSPLRWFHRWC